MKEEDAFSNLLNQPGGKEVLILLSVRLESDQLLALCDSTKDMNNFCTKWQTLIWTRKLKRDYDIEPEIGENSKLLYLDLLEYERVEEAEYPLTIYLEITDEDIQIEDIGPEWIGADIWGLYIKKKNRQIVTILNNYTKPRRRAARRGDEEELVLTPQQQLERDLRTSYIDNIDLLLDRLEEGDIATILIGNPVFTKLEILYDGEEYIIASFEDVSGVDDLLR